MGFHCNMDSQILFKHLQKKGFANSRLENHVRVVLDRRPLRAGRFPHRNSKEDWLVDHVLSNNYVDQLWKRPSLVVEVTEFKGPRGLPDLFIARVDINRLKARFLTLGIWTFDTKSLAFLRAALQDAPMGLKLENLKSRYQGSSRSLYSALENACKAGAVELNRDVVKLSDTVRRIVQESLAIEAKANSAPLALSHSLRYRTFSHRVAILVPNGIQDPAQIQERGVGLIRPINESVHWFFRPRKIGPTIKTEEFLAEEVLLKYLFGSEGSQIT